MREHGLNAILAILFSVLIWCAVGAQLTEQDSVAVDFRIVIPPPDDMILSHQGKPSTGSELLLESGVTIEVRGPKEQISRLSELGLRGCFILDAADRAEALKNGELIVDPVKYVAAPKPLEVVRATPSRLRLEVQQIEHRLVSVKPGEVVGELAKGYRIGSVKVKPRRVAVQGAAAVLDQNPGPYVTEPIDLGQGETEGFEEVERAVICPDGVVAQRGVLVSVEVVPELVLKPIEFPVHVLPPVPRGDGEAVKPLDYRIEAREGWYRKLTLRGPRETLNTLSERLDQARLTGTFDPDLPRAYVLASELPQQLPSGSDPQDDKLTVEVSGLPHDVDYTEKSDFPVRLVPVE